MKTLRLEKINISIILLVTSVFFLSLYDFYFPQIGYPTTPLVGLGLFVISLNFLPQRRQTSNAMMQYHVIMITLLFGLLLVLSFIWGYFRFGSIQLKGLIGISLGAILLAIVLFNEKNKDDFYTAVNVVLQIHVTFWFIQFIYYLILGSYLDYIEPITGIASRFEFATFGFSLTRFTGLFAEPAIYATFVFMGLTVRLIRNNYRFNNFDFALIFTVLISLSIYGYFLVFALILAYFLKASIKRKLIILFGGSILLVVFFVILSFSPEIQQYFQRRILSPLEDPSGIARFLGAIEFFKELPEEAIILGTGVGNYNMTFGTTNGIAYLLEYFGWIGVFFISLIFILLVYGRRIAPVIWLFLIVSLFGAPLLTNLYWWYWIGLLIIFGTKERIFKNERIRILPKFTNSVNS